MLSAVLIACIFPANANSQPAKFDVADRSIRAGVWRLQPSYRLRPIARCRNVATLPMDG